MNRTFTGLLLALSMALGDFILAQEELPPPPPAPAPTQPVPRQPVRGERIERLRQFGGRFLDGLANPTPGQGQGLGAGVDVGRLNEGVEELVEPIVTRDPALDSLRLYFDPQETNLAQDRIALMAVVGLNHTAWSPQPSNLEVQLRGRVEPTAGGPLQASASGRLMGTTDVLALSNYAVPRLRERMRSQVRPGAPDEEIKLRMLRRLEQTGPIRSLDELADLITSMASLNFLAKTEEIDRVRNELARVTDPLAQRDLEGRLDELRFERDALLAIRPTIVRAPNGDAAQIVIKLGDIRGSQAAYIDALEVMIAHNQVTIAGQAGVGQGVELYMLAKPLVIGTLARIQSRDPRTLEFQRGMVDGWWRQGRSAVVGEGQ
ncbi:MAG: hypothetical protein HY000_20905 [Planctomycetes bacterium]|nr:hypothetical protein [Planctomycetota bacterium]